jgi:hypothetical protein
VVKREERGREGERESERCWKVQAKRVKQISFKEREGETPKITPIYLTEIHSSHISIDTTRTKHIHKHIILYSIRETDKRNEREQSFSFKRASSLGCLFSRPLTGSIRRRYWNWSFSRSKSASDLLDPMSSLFTKKCLILSLVFLSSNTWEMANTPGLVSLNLYNTKTKICTYTYIPAMLENSREDEYI